MSAFRMGTVGGFGGMGVDESLGMMGMNSEIARDPKTGQPILDPETGQPVMQTSNRFARMGATLGMGLGAGRAGLQTTQRYMGASTPAWVRNATGTAVRGEQGALNFMYGTLDPMLGGLKAVVRKPIQLASGGRYSGGAWVRPHGGVIKPPPGSAPDAVGKFVPRPISAARTAGRVIGGAGLAAGGIGYGYNKLQNDIARTVDQNVDRVYNDAMPVLQDDMASMLDQYMASRGLTDPHTGQFSPGRNMLGGADGIFQALGLDPSRMSPIQKLMILGGAIGGGGGLIGGSPSLAGAGGLSMLGGLLPSMTGQQGQGGQAGYRPGQAAGYNGHGPNSMPPNAPSSRDEWMLQQQLQGG